MSKSFWINIDKPYGYSSAKVVAIVKKITGAKKVGHAGTLDPLATGVLPIAVNKATKTCSYISELSKKYYFEITWGEFRSTDDAEGEVIERNDKRPSTLEIISALPNFIGTIKQMPPQYSAIKINGKRAYEMARSGQNAELKSREITIFKIKLIFNNQTKAAFEIECSKGTYVRSFARELASKISACGYISTLRRLQVGDFGMHNIISLAKLKNIINFSASDVLLLRLRDVLKFLSEVELDDLDALKIKNGQTIKFSQNYFLHLKSSVVKIINNGEVIGLGNYSSDGLKPINIF